MDKNDLFEVLKGTVKLISLDQLIQQRTKKLEDFCMTHYTADDLTRLEGRKQVYEFEYSGYWYSEPTFPPGKKKVLIKQYNALVASMRQIKNVRDLLVELAFEDHSDSDADFTVDTISIRKT
jgi:hypothetical protein